MGLAAHPRRQRLPFWIALRFPVLTARMEAVATRRLQQRMQQQRALHWIPRHDEQLPDFKVLARLLVVPIDGSRRELLQGRTAMPVASHAARVPRTLLEEDGLHSFFEKGVVQGGAAATDEAGC